MQIIPNQQNTPRYEHNYKVDHISNTLKTAFIKMLRYSHESQVEELLPLKDKDGNVLL